MRCAIYSRVSTDKQENLNQIHQLREFAQRQEWQIVNEFTDVVTGSGKVRRPQFDAMMTAASQRQYDVLLFFALDRLSREGALKTLTYLQQLTAYGCKWRSYTEPYIDSCGLFADAIVGFLSCVARQEHARIRERTVIGLARARAQGKVLGRPRGSGIVIDLPSVRARAAQGESLRRIARDLGCSPALLCKRLAAPAVTA